MSTYYKRTVQQLELQTLARILILHFSQLINRFLTKRMKLSSSCYFTPDIVTIVLFYGMAVKFDY